MERLLEDVSFDADTQTKALEIDDTFVDDHLGELAQNEDLSRYIL